VSRASLVVTITVLQSRLSLANLRTVSTPENEPSGDTHEPSGGEDEVSEDRHEEKRRVTKKRSTVHSLFNETYDSEDDPYMLDLEQGKRKSAKKGKEKHRKKYVNPRV